MRKWMIAPFLILILLLYSVGQPAADAPKGAGDFPKDGVDPPTGISVR